MKDKIMNYKKLIAATIGLTVCAFTGSNAMAHGGGGGGHGGGGFGGGGFHGGGFGGGGFPDREQAVMQKRLARAKHSLRLADR
jgi:hypothetical protein